MGIYLNVARTYYNVSARNSSVVGVSKSSVNRIIILHKESGHVETKRKGKCGRKRKTTSRDDTFIMRKSKADPGKTSDDLIRDLGEASIHISSSTVRRRLNEQGRFTKKAIKKQLLTSRMKKKQLQWAKRYKNWKYETGVKSFFLMKAISSSKVTTLNFSVGLRVSPCVKNTFFKV